MTAFFCFVLNALCLAVNAGIYASDPSPFGLGCMIFSGSAALYFLIAAVTE